MPGSILPVSSSLSDYFEDFEGIVFPGWTATGLWHLEDNRSSSYPIYGLPSDSHYMWYGSNQTGNFNTSDRNYGDLYSDIIDLTGFSDYGPKIWKDKEIYAIIINDKKFRSILILPEDQLTKSPIDFKNSETIISGNYWFNEIYTYGSFYLFKDKKGKFSKRESQLISMRENIKNFENPYDVLEFIESKYRINPDEVGIELDYLSLERLNNFLK